MLMKDEVKASSSINHHRDDSPPPPLEIHDSRVKLCPIFFDEKINSIIEFLNGFKDY
jgi:hypothetical protein